MTIVLRDEEIAAALALAMKRSGSMGHKDTTHSGNWLSGKPPWWRHFVGTLAEFAYAKFTGQSVDHKTIGRGDDGIDFPDGMQVKGTDTPRMPRLLVPIDQWQRKKRPKGYVLAWVHLPAEEKDPSKMFLVGVDLVGSVSLEKFTTHANPAEFGHAQCLWMAAAALDEVQGPT